MSPIGPSAEILTLEISLKFRNKAILIAIADATNNSLSLREQPPLAINTVAHNLEVMNNMPSQSDEFLSDLDKAQQDAQVAARKIADQRHYLTTLHITPKKTPEPVVRVPTPYGDAGPTNINPGPTMTFHNFRHLPMELRRKIIGCEGVKVNRVIKIFSDDYEVTVTDPATKRSTTETVLRARAARGAISPLIQVSRDFQRMARDTGYLTGFRLRYIRLSFNFNSDTLFFVNAAALNSLMGPLGDYERRDPAKEEKILKAFNKKGPQNVVLAGPVKAYEDLYSVIKKLAWVDTLILEEPTRATNTPRSRPAAREKEIVDAIEDSWKEVRPATANLPVIRSVHPKKAQILLFKALPCL
ncbi:hypothetical protein VTL71DRAFT_10370 [Oculimacula yallundae]|uniref:2EXR domain-containing protein n=1 Tax=Oculimacula yallundae TaxID=86028 RepID=A0ABR4CSW5_9HELO